MVYQSLSVCPKTRYVVTAQGMLGSPVNQDEWCFLQICERVANKCSKEVMLVDTQFTTLSFAFTSKKTQTTAQIQVYSNCLGSTKTEFNTVYIDNVNIII